MKPIKIEIAWFSEQEDGSEIIYLVKSEIYPPVPGRYFGPSEDWYESDGGSYDIISIALVGDSTSVDVDRFLNELKDFEKESFYQLLMETAWSLISDPPDPPENDE